MIEQNIPDKDKNFDWFMFNARSIYMAGSAMSMDKQRDILLWHLYNGITNDTDWDYLRKVGDFEYPAKVRHIPILKSRFQRLKSMETHRFFKPKVFSTNKNAIQSKMDLKAKAIVDLIVGAFTARIDQMKQLEQQIDAQTQQMQPKEGEQQDPTAAYKMQQLQQQMQNLKKPLQKEEIFNQRELDKVEKYYNLGYQDLWEIYANHGLKAYMDKYGIMDIFLMGFEEKIVTDQPVYCVELPQGAKEPVFRKVNMLHFYHSKKGQSDKLENADWYREDRYMSVPEIIDEFRDDGIALSTINKLKTVGGYFGFTGNVYNTPFYNPSGSVDGSRNNYFTGQNDNQRRFMVSRCVWKSVRRITFVKKPNKYLPGQFYLHFVPDDTFESDNETLVRYKTEWYEVTLINGEDPLRMRKLNSVRNEDDYSVAPGPYVGRNWDGITSRPYSLMWATKDIQILYNLINYHMELWLALSGVKGMVMDASQKPDMMTDEEWRYQRKLGTAWIQTAREGIQRQPTFNQFQSYDDTIGNSIQYLQKFMEYLENVASTIIGIFHPQLGQIEPTDQVGTYDQSQQMSNMVTEIIFYEHDQIKLRALTQLANLFKDAWKDGRMLEYSGDDLGQQILSIPSGGLDGADFIVRTNNGIEEEKKMNEIKQQTMAAYTKGEIRLNQWIKLYSSGTVKEMEAMVEKYTDEAMKLQQDSQQSSAQAQQQAMEFAESLKQQTLQVQGKIDMQLQQMKLQIDQMKLDLTKGIADQKVSADMNKAQMDDKTKNTAIQSEREVELAYLEEQRQEAQTQAELTATDIAVNAHVEKMKAVEKNKQAKQKI